MFTFIKKVIKTGTATHSYPLEPMPVDKNFRGKPEHNPQQCIGCAACVNACPSNALTVETDLATNQLAWQFNLGRCISAAAVKKFARRRRLSCRRSMNWRCGKRVSSSSRALPSVTVGSANGLSRYKKRSTTLSRCLSTTAIPAPNCTAKVLRPARNASVRNARCHPIVLN